MAHSTRTLRIGIASLIAVLVVAGSYAFSGPAPLFNLGRIAEAQSSEELLKEYAAKDTDTDGLPDWQEALYGTDPSNPESFKTGVRDGDAVAQGLVTPKVQVAVAQEQTDIASIPGTNAAPSSLTERFSRTLLTQYLTNRGETAPTNEEIVSFVEGGVRSLTAENVSPARYTLPDIKTSAGTGTVALETYAAEVEAVFSRNTVSTRKNELSYFSDAIKDDPSALEKISDISDAYNNIATALVKISVPAEAKQAHLAIVNALVHMSEASGDMATLKSDPVRALLGIGLYSPYAKELVSGFTNLNGVFSARQVSILEGSAGYYIVKTARDAAASK